MRISKDEALQGANAAKKLHVVKKRQCWLFCPYMPGAAYHTVHWDHHAKQSVQCEGDNCTYCPSKPNRKVHLPCLLYKRPKPIEHAETLNFPQDILCDGHWTPKIIELTSNCFAAIDQPFEEDQLAIAWRPGPNQNSPLFFRWIQGHLRNVPPELADLDINKILPGVIGGTYRTHNDLTLTEGPISSIKHNSNDKSLCQLDGIGGAA